MPFYAVHKGKRRGIYTDWNECKSNIFGVKHPIFKKFNTKEEAEYFLIHGFGTKTNQSMADTLGCKKVVGESHGDEKQSGTGEAGEIEKIDKIKNSTTDGATTGDNDDKHIIHIFTDGSLIRKKNKNGDAVLLCGYGIYIPAYGLMDELRYAGTITENKTNNRGELKGIIDGLNYIMDCIEDAIGDAGENTKFDKLKNTQIVLYTDSSYSKLILGNTGEKYRKAGYVIKGEQVKNADMVREIMEIRDRIASHKLELIVKHVYSHTNLDSFEANGNRLADEYANIGAKNMRV
jgi:ribonuclease HI